MDVVGDRGRRRSRAERGIYRQPNGNYTVCFMTAGKPRFRTIGDDLGEARRARAWLIEAGRRGEVPVSPRLRFDTVASWWLARFAEQVDAGERHERTLEKHHYHVQRHLLSSFGHRRVAASTVADVAALLTELGAKGCSARTAEGARASLHSIMRYALRHGWIVEDPVAKLEAGERPRGGRRRHRVLGRGEIRRLLAACPPPGLPLLTTALYTGMRISELLGLIWQDVDLEGGTIRVSAQLSRAHHGVPARRVAPKTRAAMREMPLSAQLAAVLSEHHERSTSLPSDRPRSRATGSSRRAPAHHSGTATRSSACSGAPLRRAGSKRAVGRRCASTTCATRLQAIGSSTSGSTLRR